MNKKRSSEIFGAKMEIFSENNVILVGEKFFRLPQTRRQVSATVVTLNAVHHDTPPDNCNESVTDAGVFKIVLSIPSAAFRSPWQPYDPQWSFSDRLPALRTRWKRFVKRASASSNRILD